MTGILIAMLLGVAASACLHVSQGMMRLGIQRLKDRQPGRLVYGTGLVLNFSAPLWVMVANLFAPTLWFTSMFATGLVSLLVFARCVLGETVSSWQVGGALLLIAGTLLVAGGGLVGTTPTEVWLPVGLLLGVSAFWAITTPLLALSLRRQRLNIQEIYFGLAAGGFFALDALWKSAAQRTADGNVSFLPTDALGGLILLASFGGAGGAFAMMQWSYLRHCRASQVVVGYNVVYVALPLLLTAYVAGAGILNALTLGGLLLVVTGAVAVVKR